MNDEWRWSKELVLYFLMPQNINTIENSEGVSPCFAHLFSTYTFFLWNLHCDRQNIIRKKRNCKMNNCEESTSHWWVSWGQFSDSAALPFLTWRVSVGEDSVTVKTRRRGRVPGILKSLAFEHSYGEWCWDHVLEPEAMKMSPNWNQLECCHWPPGGQDFTQIWDL